MAKYLSKEWVAAGKALADKDSHLRTVLDGMDASILCVVHETPDHADEVFYIDFGDGDLRELYSGTKEEFAKRGRKATFEVHGDYNTFTLIQEGHLTQTTAVMRGRLKLKGGLVKAMRHMRAMDALVDTLRKVPTEF